MRVIGLAGWSGAGKTTLLVGILPELRRRGLSVSTVKHAHHGFDVDQPGKDSYEHRAAGASEVLIASSRRFALMHELRDEPEPTLLALLRRLSPVDLVIVEGFKTASHPKVEVYRKANGKPLLIGTIPNVRAVASDVPLPGLSVPVVGLGNLPAVADMLFECADALESVTADPQGPAHADRSHLPP
jgi:molybdopterin-guanine dinucleotide biosynthesis adapter protein